MDDRNSNEIDENSIAIIGMSCQVPGANNLTSLWQMVSSGAEGIRRSVKNTAANYVGASSYLPDIELFDAALFNVSDKNAELMDPQHRLFLHHALTALEDGNVVVNDHNRIGVFATCNYNTYLLEHWQKIKNNINSVGNWAHLLHLNAADHLATKVAHKLNLKGPCLSVHTACSSSLAAVHLAVQSLLLQESELALVGGSAVFVPQSEGYYYEAGSIASHDGYCRPFSDNASGTIFGSGVGVVVLKRLNDALNNNDNIYAIIKGCALNNDGNSKMHFTSPSISGQQAVITEALDIAGVKADTIGYLEAHGTGTSLGDPIEIKAATAAYRRDSTANQYCYLGSIKANIGHLNAAAGIIGLIKTALVINKALIPPLINFNSPNKEINFDASPFKINLNSSLPWPSSNSHRRRAAVSSFGIGGTNVHAVLEEAPPRQSLPSSIKFHALVWSAPSCERLEKLSTAIHHYLSTTPHHLADIAYTLQYCRHQYEHRRFIICRSIEEAIQKIEKQQFNNSSDIDRNDNEMQQKLQKWLEHGLEHLYMYNDENRLKVTVPTAVFIPKYFWCSEAYGTEMEEKYYTRPKLEVEFTEAKNDLEKQLLQIWIEKLKVKPIGIDDEFYALGGDSLLATQVLTRIHERLPLTLDTDIFDLYPTVRTMARYLDQCLQAKVAQLTEEEAFSILDQA